MQKLFGLVVIVLGVWIGMEVYTNGAHGAFGGVFARFSDAPAGEAQSPLESIQQRGENARNQQLDRIENQLDQP